MVGTNLTTEGLQLTKQVTLATNEIIKQKLLTMLPISVMAQ